MPIEIRELVIKMVVEEAASGGNSKSGSSGNVNGTNKEERLVNICVEKVFEILKEKNER